MKRNRVCSKLLSFALAASMLATSWGFVPMTAQAEETNILAGKTPTTTEGVEITNPEAATDGILNDSTDDSKNTEILAGTETGESDNGYSTWNQVYLQYDFENLYDVESVTIYRNSFANAICDFKDVKIELSETEDFADPTVIYGTEDVKETEETKGNAQVINLDETVTAQYIRIYGKGQYIQNLPLGGWAGYSNAVRFHEIVVTGEEHVESANIVAGKIPTTSAGIDITNPEAATDGVLNDSANDSKNTEILAGTETGESDNGYSTWNQVYLQYDFENLYDVESITIYRNSFANAICDFKDVKIELSETEDFADPTVIYGTEDVKETEETKGSAQIINLDETVTAQYIRIYGKGQYIQNLPLGGWAGYSNAVRFHEIQVMGVPSSATETKVLDSIEITTAPTKTEYTEGETFDTTGMVVTANWSNGTQTDVTEKVTYSTEELKTTDTSVTVTYTYDGVTKEATQAITVKEAPVDPDAPLKETNILEGLTPTSNVEIKNADCATDGLIGGSDDDTNNTEIQAGTEAGGEDNGYSTWDQVYLQYDFGKAYDVKSVKIYRNTFANAICDFKDVKIELSADEEFTNPTVIYETADVVETVDTKGEAQVINLENTVNAKYIRVYGQGQYIQNTNSSWKGFSNAVRFNEIQVFADVPEKMVVTNIMLGLEPSSNSEHMIAGDSFTVPTVQIKYPEAATDGIVGGSDDDSNNTKIIAGEETGGSDNGLSNWDDVYLQYDFGKERKVTEVKLYRNTYANAVSTYYNTKVELSEDEDFTNPTIIYGPTDYEETVDTKGEPIVITLDEPVKAKYIRVWGKGHYIQNTNSSWKGNSNGVLFNEIQAFAAVPESELPSAPEDEAVNIAANKVPYVYGVIPENIEAITDGKVDDNYASMSSNSGAERWLQFEYRNQYAFKTINFKLEEGTYDSVKVSISSSATGGGNVIFSETNFTQGEEMNSITLDSNNIGKYVRFAVKKSGSESTVDIKYSEIELWATGKNYDESKSDYVAPESKYDTLVWSDEFNDDVVDESKWKTLMEWQTTVQSIIEML
ncbi:MAG: discoidin domain-containing protein [Ruminococcus sp.]|nr:discoidin domain-containing protein [Ruminococcus sp.]